MSVETAPTGVRDTTFSPWRAEASHGRVRLRTLVLLRWLAIAGQSAALVFVYFGLGFDFPIVLAGMVVGASIWLNVAVLILFRSGRRLSNREASLYLGFDLLNLSILLYLTGGLQNPFSLLMMVPVTISATILDERSTLGLGLLAIVCVIVLTEWHLPLPFGEPGLQLPQLYLLGIETALILGMVFIAVYAWRVAAEARRMSQALTATQMALAREQKMAAVGALAAAAAHELGTPLGTITLVAKEMMRELPADSPLGPDMALLRTEVARCREILAQLSRRPDAPGDNPFERVSLPVLAEEVAAANRERRPETDFLVEATGDGPAPLVDRGPELLHALGNLIDNAGRHAESQVEVVATWTADRVELMVRDDGPGFPPEILAVIGEPYVTTRAPGEGMGLGVFIAKTLLEHTGAEVIIGNRSEGGAEVAIVWGRAILERVGGR
ncbi:ActS/PrrB/RegB family redox-sensitive histidine kinase [Zavarzinia sp. CC-PAN008]|uniref:ActS/PrrB/RegB family redox-sensitive histidine kinase n=1 Tax=Zavarzinia sp. CC-PAN008 TaxID=3243332 RepID=UPI003F74449B